MRLVILYASQTGTAQEYAERVGRDAFRREIEYKVQGMHEYNAKELVKEEMVVLLVSTTGDGEAPNNMKGFWEYLLQRHLPNDWLKNVRMAVMGLGDSSYEKFNYVGKRLYRRLEQLGANLIVSRGDADEQHPLGLDGTFIPWTEGIWRYGTEKLGWPPQPIKELTASVLIMKAPPTITNLDDSHTGEKPMVSPSPSLPSTENIIQAILVENKRITKAGHFQDVRHLVFTSESIPSYYPGDVAIISPENPAWLVDELVSLIGWGELADEILSFTALRVEANVPTVPLSLRRLLSTFLDITAPPKRYFFTILSKYVKDDHPSATIYREKLIELADPSGIDAYLDYVWKPRRTPIEVLKDFSVKIPASYVFDLFPKLRPREYSIASSSIQNPGQIHLCAALVRYQTILAKFREGVCSRWLSELKVGSLVSLTIRPGSWAIPTITNMMVPLVMIASGTGVAPIRALIHHVNSSMANRNFQHHQMYLFFGCRYLNSDFHYQDEWKTIPNLTVFAKGSRDNNARPDQKSYVDSLLWERKELLIKVLSEGAFFYVAGNSKLPALIKRTFVGIFEDPNLPSQLMKNGRLYVEAWS